MNIRDIKAIPTGSLVRITAEHDGNWWDWSDIVGGVEDSAFERHLSESETVSSNPGSSDAAKSSVTVKAFGGVNFDLFEPPEVEDGQALVSTAVENLIAAGPELRDSATPYVMQYYRSVREQFNDEECEEYGIPLEIAVEEIWDHVDLNSEIDVQVNVGSDSPYLHADSAYLIFEGNCSWEEEHGILLSYLNGARIARVSSYDGHPTNANASAKPELLDTVFHA